MIARGHHDSNWGGIVAIHQQSTRSSGSAGSASGPLQQARQVPVPERRSCRLRMPPRHSWEGVSGAFDGFSARWFVGLLHPFPFAVGKAIQVLFFNLIPQLLLCLAASPEAFLNTASASPSPHRLALTGGLCWRGLVWLPSEAESEGKGSGLYIYLHGGAS
jgi:hypothetical protein